MNRIVRHKKLSAIVLLFVFGLSLVANFFVSTSTSYAATDLTPSASGVAASDATLTYTDNGVEKEIPKDITDLSHYVDLNVNYHWSIADGVPISNGDTLKFNIPENVNINFPNKTSDLTFKIYASDEKTELGRAVVTHAGPRVGIITFNSALEGTTTDRSGDISISGAGVVTSTGGSGTGGDSAFLTKVGWFPDSDKDVPSTMVWNIVANPRGSKNVSNLVLTDTLGEGQIFDSSSMSVQAKIYGNPDSQDPTSVEDIPVGSNLISNDKGFTLNIGDTHKEIVLVYETKITTPINPEDKFTWSNSVKSSYTNPGDGSDPSSNPDPGSGTGTKPDEPIVSEVNQTKTFGASGSASGRNGTVVLTKVDSADHTKTLPGAHFELVEDDGTTDGKVIPDTDEYKYSDLVTDDKGQITIPNLPVGKYTFIETSPPTGYTIDKNNDRKSFTIAANQKLPLQFDFSDVKEGTPTPKTGSVVLTKTSEDDGTPLSGATFKLLDANDNLLQSGLTTDKNGQIKVDNLPVAKGYKFIETDAPKGYQRDDSPHAFSITADQTKAIEVPVTDKKIVVTPFTGSVILTKIAPDRTPLKDAEFRLEDTKGTILQSGLTTDKNGQITVDKLEAGSYQFVETDAPKGYKLDQTPHIFTIVDNQKTATGVTVTDEVKNVTPPAPETGSVILTKTSKYDNKPLQGAVFDLQDKDGKIIQQNLSTDKNGEITVDKLVAGDYQFVETKAPSGYTLDTTAHTFTIDPKKDATVKVLVKDEKESGNVTPPPVTNPKGNVILTKTDAKTKNVLKNAVFDLKDANGNVVKSDLTTDVNGQIKVTDLTPGTYQFVETKAPKGYKLSSKPAEFVVKDGETTEVSMTNEVTSTTTTPTTPENPEKPTTPTTPEVPGTPDKPTVPTNPVIPTTPGYPNVPNNPETPTNPLIPAVPGSNIPVTSTPSSDVHDNSTSNKLPQTGIAGSNIELYMGLIVLVIAISGLAYEYVEMKK